MPSGHSIGGHGVSDLPAVRFARWYPQRQGLLQSPACLLGGDIKTGLPNTLCPGACRNNLLPPFPPSPLLPFSSSSFSFPLFSLPSPSSHFLPLLFSLLPFFSLCFPFSSPSPYPSASSSIPSPPLYPSSPSPFPFPSPSLFPFSSLSPPPLSLPIALSLLLEIPSVHPAANWMVQQAWLAGLSSLKLSCGVGSTLNSSQLR